MILTNRVKFATFCAKSGLCKDATWEEIRNKLGGSETLAKKGETLAVEIEWVEQLHDFFKQTKRHIITLTFEVIDEAIWCAYLDGDEWVGTWRELQSKLGDRLADADLQVDESPVVKML